ncbi:MAG: anhydro-N-acetylmuramic acid kinase [Anaerolineae bacterium]|nr:anhydro-N-acetylmuramic acid kinase [Anaerolineae bacterium]
MNIIGLMSGTSADGIDVAVVEMQGAAGAAAGLDWRLRGFSTVPFAPDLQREILHCVTSQATVDRICALNFALGDAFAQAAISGAEAAGLRIDQIDAIGSHGQTVWHIPGQATLQIGSGAVIAERTGVTTISNFRARDIAAGGQGAPLVAYVDVMLLTHPTRTRAAQNIGGIGNVTFLPKLGDSAHAFAFDTGPGNMLIDDVARRMTNGEWQCDMDGQLAAAGQVDGTLFEELMDHPFLAQAPPKTTGREMFGAHFGAEIWRTAQARHVSGRDIAATVTLLTAASIARAYAEFLPRLPDEVIVSGGGARNPTLMRMLGEQLRQYQPHVQVLTSDELGINSDAKEAIAFAMLAYETLHQRPSNLPAATGARHAVILGDISPGFTRFLPQS